MTIPDTEATDASAGEARGPRGIQSIEVGGQLLLALAHHGRPLALKDLAREAGMPPAKAHPYLVSFQKIGLVAQESGSGRYGLGPLALQLGLISLQQFDPVRLATPVIEELALSTGLTLAIAVWGNRGPTLVRIAEAPSPVHVSMRHGTVMSLKGTASGQLFAACLPQAEVRAAWPAEEVWDEAFSQTLSTIRTQDLAWVDGSAVPGVRAMAAPVRDGSGRLVLSLTAIGPSALVNLDARGPLAQALRQAAGQLSAQLGWRAAEAVQA
ncbi:IclR family transcriptional regulator [Ideonella livida]|uniref:IclR family transcriptional regulator n=1 Tax=Ideonella livida TaxID=2707176 RepID=A0A7C9PH05_9BURK|nr:IclR family transcriptional regulator [Ideonella livida]NDY91693.1 IclR family transcriptional regulator [Ideonella livida]